MRGTAMLVLVAAALVCGPAAGFAADAAPEAALTIQNRTFAPPEIRVKARTPFMLAITNRDKSSALFVSQSMKIEKLVPAGQTVRIRVGALEPGVYPVANARIVAE